jgi:hypothetical protein
VVRNRPPRGGWVKPQRLQVGQECTTAIKHKNYEKCCQVCESITPSDNCAW